MSPPPNLEPVELLLVEDSDDDAELTLRALARHRLTNAVRRLSDGQEALDFLRAEGPYAARANLRPPRVVLLDLKLPKVDGLEVLAALRADERTRRLAVVVLTSSKEDRDLERAYALGVNSYIVKPVEFDAFLLAIERVGIYWMLLNETPT